MFPPEVYQARRQALQKRLGSGLLLFPGGSQSPRNFADNTYPFRQDSSFLYYFGIPIPGVAAVIDPAAGTSTLFMARPGMMDLVWTGAEVQPEEWRDRAGMDRVKDIKELPGCLSAVPKEHIHYLPPFRTDTRVALHRLGNIPLDLVDREASIDLVQAVISQRAIKEAREIAQIKQAIAISRECYRKLLQRTAPGMTTGMLKGFIDEILAAHGSCHAFAPIITTHGEVLHHGAENAPIRAGDMVLVDAGAESAEGYAADITRTFPAANRFSSRQREIYQVVLNAQQAAIAAIRPGITYLAVHRQACIKIAEGLRQLGLLRGNMHEAVEAGAHALFFVHGLGHFLGLDAHDMESLGEDRVGYAPEQTRSPQFGLASLRLARTLETGFCLTVEPGLYFIPRLIDLWQAEKRCARFINYGAIEAFRGLGGIRIEDDVLVTPQGAEVLSPIPRKAEDIEKIRSTRRL